MEEKNVKFQTSPPLYRRTHPDYLHPLILCEVIILHPELIKKTAVCVIGNACGKTAYTTTGVLESMHMQISIDAEDGRFPPQEQLRLIDARQEPID